MKKVKISSIFMVCLLTMSLLFTATCVRKTADSAVQSKSDSGSAADTTEQNKSGGVNYEMVRVPGGSFQMGSNDDLDNEYGDVKPVHTVTLSAFSIGKYEVTQALYESVMGYNPSYFNGFTDSTNRPAEQVTWYDAVEFCNMLSEKERLQPVYVINGRNPETGYPIKSATVMTDWSKNGYRLPTEAQWEYAARGGNGSPGNYIYSGSNDVNTVAWYEENSDGAPQVVGTKAPNSLGIYDMSGNVWEWCYDWYGNYSNEMQIDPPGASSSRYHSRVSRGGSWSRPAKYARYAIRVSDDPGLWFSNVGFRVVRPTQ